MPEGDTIWRTAAALRPRLVGSRVRRSSHTGLEDRDVVGVDAVGKHLLIRFEGGWTLHTHMGMTGSWHVYRPGQRWREPSWKARAVLECDEWVAVCFSAPRVQLTRDPGRPVAHLGPDILVEPFDAGRVAALARGAESRAIGEVLQDQRVCAGIGNVYRCEALWEHRLSPWQDVGDIDEPTLRALYEWTRASMVSNLRGPIARRFAGGRPAAVHRRGAKPCPRCGTRIAVERQGALARWTYYCPACQPSPAGFTPTRRRTG